MFLGLKNLKVTFDQVLLDAPCSALGLRPRLFAEVVEYFPEQNVRLRRKICLWFYLYFILTGIAVFTTYANGFPDVNLLWLPIKITVAFDEGAVNVMLVSFLSFGLHFLQI